MASEANSPAREQSPLPSSIPQKRAAEDDHQPAVSSPLNPSFARDDAPLARDRAARAKKESLKKRESKAGSIAPESRATPDPKSSPSKHRDNDGTIAPLRYKLPPPKASDFEAPRGPVFIPHHTITAPDGSQIHFQETSDHVYNKKGFRYTHCIADPAFPSILHYRQSETEPFGPRLNFEDAAAHMFHDESGRHTTTDKGFRMARANVCVREGRYYYECKITKGVPKKRDENTMDGVTTGNVRVGWARREASLETNVGFDAYSYGLRDVSGQVVWMSRPKDFFPPGEEIQEGDIIGLEINLPSQTLHRKIVEGQYNPAVDLDDDESNQTTEVADTIRDRVPIRFKSHLFFEQIDYTSVKELEELMNPSPILTSSGGSVAPQAPSPTHPLPALRTLPKSSIKVYKNGTLMGTAFTDLLAFLPPASRPQAQVGAREGLDDGMLGYYPAVSVFRGGAVEVNLGPDFWYPPPGYEDHDDEVDMVGSDQLPVSRGNKIKAAADRYDEQIVEDVLYDLVDEVDFWIQDGGATGGANDRAMLSVNRASNLQDGALDDRAMPSEEIKELVQDDE